MCTSCVRKYTQCLRATVYSGPQDHVTELLGNHLACFKLRRFLGDPCFKLRRFLGNPASSPLSVPSVAPWAAVCAFSDASYSFCNALIFSPSPPAFGFDPLPFSAPRLLWPGLVPASILLAPSIVQAFRPFRYNPFPPLRNLALLLLLLLPPPPLLLPPTATPLPLLLAA